MGTTENTCKSVAWDLVEALRREVDLPNPVCVRTVETVLDGLLEFCSSGSYVITAQDIQGLRDAVTDCQEAVSEEQARQSFDFQAAITDVEAIENFRSSVNNREYLWPGGAYSSASAANVVLPTLQNLRKRFESTNPKVLTEILNYPGRDHPDRFKVLAIICRELDWVLEDVKFSPASLEAIAAILLKCLCIHSEVVAYLSSLEKLHISIPMIIQKSYQTQKPDLALQWIQVATSVISTLAVNPQRTFEELSSRSCFEPELWAPVFSCILADAESKLTAGEETVYPEYTALFVAFCFLHSLPDPRAIPEILHRIFLGHELTTVKFVGVVVSTCIEWFNHDCSGSQITGYDIGEDYGLKNSTHLIPGFLRLLLPLHYVIASHSALRFFMLPLSESEATDPSPLAAHPDAFPVLSASERGLLADICQRVLRDHEADKDDILCKEAETLLRELNNYAEIR